MNQVNLIKNWVPWQPGSMQFEELSQFETLLLIAHFHKYRMYSGKHEKQSQICKKLKKKEGSWNEQDWEGEKAGVLVAKERWNSGCVISSIHQRREIAGFIVTSFSRQHFDVCSSKVYWNGIYLYKSSKKKKRVWEKNTASRDFKCVEFHGDLIFPLRVLH